MQEEPRSALPNRPDPTEEPVFSHYKGMGRSLPPGPGRNYDEKHFVRSERIGAILMWFMLAVLLFWIGVDAGLLPDVFNWH